MLNGLLASGARVRPAVLFAIAFCMIACVAFIPHAVLAQTAGTGSTLSAGGNCAAWNGGFSNLIAGFGAAGNFFQGTVFKIGCIIAIIIAGIVLLFDDGQMGRIVQLILRAILVVGFVLGAASFLSAPSVATGC